MGRPPNRPEDIWKRIGRGVSGFCWDWPGSKAQGGYGAVTLAGKTHMVHRWTYEQLVGPIPEGMHIDHLCRNRGCVNPDHLEPVMPAENTRRGLLSYAIRTECVRGHELAEVFTRKDGRRRCRVCHREDSLNSFAKSRSLAQDSSRRCAGGSHHECLGNRRLAGKTLLCECPCHKPTRKE